MERYITVLYYAVLMLGCNEMGPVRPIDMFVSGIMLLMAQLASIFLFGEIVSILSELMRKNVSAQ